MDNPSRRYLYLIGLAAAILYLIAAWHERQEPAPDAAGQTAFWGWKATEVVPIETDRPSFQEIALKYGTTKVTTHRYHFMYEKYLPAIRDRAVKLLEIGLDCNMYDGLGPSYYTWLEYFPKIHLYFISQPSDAGCADAWSRQTDRALVFPGDPGDASFLASFAAQTTVHGLFDVIIDAAAGGRLGQQGVPDEQQQQQQQRTALESLWPALRPGGVYFVEDIRAGQIGWRESQDGDEVVFEIADVGGGVQLAGEGHPSALGLGKRQAMATYLYELLDDVMGDGRRHAISPGVRSIDCMREICAIFKKEEGAK